MRGYFFIYVGIVLLLYACKNQPNQSEVRSMVIVNLKAVKNAEMGGAGAGQFKVSSSEAINVTCTNCGEELSLSFRSASEDGKLQAATFQFPYVEKTYLCKLNLFDIRI